jgi:hypothetical protein
MAALTAVIAGAASAALAGCLWQIGTRVRALESQRTEAPAAPEASGATGRRSSKPMLGALYHEPSPSPLSGLTSLPGGHWLGAALVLGIVAAGLSGFSPSRSEMDASRPDSTLMSVQGRVDSLSQVVARLRDSMQVAIGAAAGPASTKQGSDPARVAKAPARSRGGVLAAPPPPVGAPAP